jgi:Ca-activated chloride channel family protein
MNFLWPFQLVLLVIVPFLMWWYWRDQKLPAESVVFHPDLEFLKSVSTPTFSRNRDIPAILYLLAVGLGIFALARPTAALPVPDNKTTIMLAIDVSLSMRADDIKPSRFEAAQGAARIFVKQLPAGTKIGLVSFSGYAAVNVEPTSDHNAVLEAIDQLSLGRGTAIGAGLQLATQALPERGENAKIVRGQRLPPAAIVLLTDGRNNRPPEPLEIAAEVRNKDVRVYTVGLGTDAGSIDFQGGGMTVGFDPETLRTIADTTNGKYFEAKSSGQLNGIYQGLGRSIGWTTKPGEITGLFAAIAGVLLLSSIFLSERSRRIV